MQNYPDPTLQPDHYRAHEAAPVDVGDDVLVHMVAGAGFRREEFPLRYEVVSISPPNGLSCRNEYVLRAKHDDPPYMMDGVSDTTILPQLRKGKAWETL